MFSIGSTFVLFRLSRLWWQTSSRFCCSDANPDSLRPSRLSSHPHPRSLRPSLSFFPSLHSQYYPLFGLRIRELRFRERVYQILSHRGTKDEWSVRRIQGSIKRFPIRSVRVRYINQMALKFFARNIGIMHHTHSMMGH